MVLTCFFVCTLVILFLTYTVWKNRSLPPGPWGIPLLGFLPWINPETPYITLTELSKKYGSIYGLNLGSVYTVVLTDPKIVRSVFSKDITTGRAPLYLTHGIMNGYGLICAEGELWRDQRKFVVNCLRQFGLTKFGQNRHKMESLIKYHVNDFVKFLKGHGDKIHMDPLEPLRHSLGSIMNVIVFGKCWSRDDNLWTWLQHLQEEGTRYIGVAGAANFLSFLRFLPKYQEILNFLIDGKHKTHKVYQEIIQEQAGLLNQFSEPENIIQAFIRERENKPLSIREKFYNDKQFYHLLADIFGAALDTTLTTLRWYLLYLAKDLNVQENVRKEIRGVLQDQEPSIDDMAFLPLVQASISEAQRIRSVVPIGIPHGSIGEMCIEDYRIPKGSMIVCLQWAIHMNEKVWIDPEKFDPNRFLDDDGKFYKNENFLPFQVGKRMCIGDELARILLFFYATIIVQNFSFTLEDEDVDFTGECGITLTPKPYKLKFISCNV